MIFPFEFFEVLEREVERLLLEDGAEASFARLEEERGHGVCAVLLPTRSGRCTKHSFNTANERHLERNER